MRNLDTGAVLRSCPIGGAIAPSTLPHVTDIVRGPDGDVGWNAEGEGLGEGKPGCDPTA